MPTPHMLTRAFSDGADAAAVEAWAAEAADALPGPATLALVFVSQSISERTADLLEIVRIYGRTPAVAGCSGIGLIEGGNEIENGGCASIALIHLPDSEAHVIRLENGLFDLDQDERARRMREAVGDPSAFNAWLMFADPYGMNNERWLADWDAATVGRNTIGGLTSSDPRNPQSLILAGGEIHDSGAVAVGIRGQATIEPLLSQGCRPIGSPWVITKAEENVIHQVGNRPILEVLRDTLETIPDEDKQLARGNVFVGLVHDEYKERYEPGDFLVRNLAAIDPRSGAVAIASKARIGQNLQFQIRDAETAAEDLHRGLELAANRLHGRSLYGACSCNCIGRGSGFFATPGHDAALIRETFPGLPISGFFANGELGPARPAGSPAGPPRTSLHGYSNSLGFFASKDPG